MNIFLHGLIPLSLMTMMSLFIHIFDPGSPGKEQDDSRHAKIPKLFGENETLPVAIVKDFTYEKYTLEDTYMYKDIERKFQWDSIRNVLSHLEKAQSHPTVWVTLQNYKNLKGIAPLTEGTKKDEYNAVTDIYGVSRYQSIPLYPEDDFETPARYARDGALFRYLGDSLNYLKVCSMMYDGAWYVPDEYAKILDVARFDKIAFVDRTNQNIALLEKGDTAWYVRSMNPATTGLHRPPYQQETPLGTYVVQEKKPRMYYTHDGSSEMAGYAPYASRFTRGGYIHGIPLNSVNATEKDYIEFSSTLGTTPRSHMCVRNATSHAKYVYDWAPALESLVVVIE